MNKLLLLLCGQLLFVALSSHAENDEARLECVKSASFLAPIDSPDYRKYAPDRDVEILHLALEVTPNFTNRTVEGRATWTCKPISKPVRDLTLDAVDLTFREVTASEKIQAYNATDKKITITFAEPIPAGKEISLKFSWSAEPKEGLYFRTPEMGYPAGDAHVFTQGEEIEARHWYPCFDAPNMKFTSEITCHLPAGMTAVSNGRLISETTDSANGLVTVHWSQEKPHANYLISLVAGYLKKIEDKYKDIPIAFYTPPSEINEASNSFRDTKDMLGFFEREIGVNYPWPKYDQVCVFDFVAGGMENTTCTTLTDSTLFTSATENIRNSEGLVAHEMAHQWFGDFVTCKDWSHIWLNESFATYYESLYNEHKNGRDSMLYELYGRTRQITGITNNFKPIVRRNFNTSGEMFDYLAYPKGGWVLHMLRTQLGPDLFRRCIKTYLDRHAYGNVVTDDLRSVIEELSGRSFDQFFDQWLYHGYHPELEAAYSWDEKTMLAKVSIRQTQKVSEEVALFNFPLTIRFQGKAGVVDRLVQVKEKEEDFYFPLDASPKIVRLDPDYTLLAKITFKQTSEMLRAQLGDQKDMIGRILAINQLSEKKDRDSVEQLKKALNADGFYGVRIETARGLRQIHTDEALAALIASSKQDDARVRQAVVGSIAHFYSDKAYTAGLDTIKSEKNPDIVSAALGGIAGYAKPEVHDTLVKFLKSESYRNESADVAVNAIRSQDDPAYIAPLLETLTSRESSFTSRGFGSGLETLAYLARNEKDKASVRKYLISKVNDKRQRVQIAAITALGTLDDPQALAVVQKLTESNKESPERTAAEKSVAALRAGRKPADDFKNLRQEVIDLQKTNRELRKDLDELKKKVEASKSATEPKKKKAAIVPPKNR